MVNKCLDPTNVFFLLSRWYAEDCERLRLLQPLKNLRGHPIDILVSFVLRPQRLIASPICPQVHTEGDLLDYRPYVMQEEEEWEANTQLPYDPFASCAVLQNHRFDCPSCGHGVVARKSASSRLSTICLHCEAYLSDTGRTGYAQKGFFINCGACNFRITRETLAVAKFARDLVLDPNSPSDFFVFKCAVYLPYVIAFDSSHPMENNVPQGHSTRLLRQTLR